MKSSARLQHPFLGRIFSDFKAIRTILRMATVVLTILFMSGCSSFTRDWKRSAREPVANDSIEGAWEGKWVSDANGHTGRLRCLLTRQDDSHYEARFWATYWKILRFTYTVPLSVEQREGKWHFIGSENLGKAAGGVYEYAGHATPAAFWSTYKSKYDHGTFEMGRPE